MSSYGMLSVSMTIFVQRVERAIKFSDWVTSTEHFQFYIAISYVCRWQHW